jgi:hypothetical protein
VNRRAASGGGAWGRRAALPCSFRSLPDTVLVVQKVFPVNSSLFWGYYCNFNVIFV